MPRIPLKRGGKGDHTAFIYHLKVLCTGETTPVTPLAEITTLHILFEGLYVQFQVAQSRMQRLVLTVQADCIHLVIYRPHDDGQPQDSRVLIRHGLSA